MRMSTATEVRVVPLPGRLQVGEWILEPDLNQLSSAGKTVKVEPKSTAVLLCLARRAGEVVSGLLHEIRRLHHLIPEISGHISSAEEVKAHAEILAALERRDPDAAAERMREHLAEVSQVLVAQFAGIQVD